MKLAKTFLMVMTGFAVQSLNPLLFLSAQAMVKDSCCSALEQINTHLELLTLYLKQGDLGAAQQALFNAQVLLQLHFPKVSSQLVFWEQVASAHGALDQFEPAFAIYESLYGFTPKGVYALRLGQLALQLQRPDEAQRWLGLAHAAYPVERFPEVLALNLWEAGLYSAAALRFQALDDHPTLRNGLTSQEQIDNRLRWVDIDLQQNEPAAANQRLATIPLALISPTLQPLLATIYLRLERFDEAAAIYESLLRLEPQNLNYVLALANSLSGSDPEFYSERRAYLFRQAFDLTSNIESVSDERWRNLLFGLAASGDLVRAEKAFLKLRLPTAADFLQGAFLAQKRGYPLQAEERFQQVLQQLPETPRTASALQQRWQAESALLQSTRQFSHQASDFHQQQARAIQRWQAVFTQGLLQSTPEGRLLLLESALALDTPEVLVKAESVLGLPVLSDQTDDPVFRLRQAALMHRQHPETAPVLYEAIFGDWIAKRIRFSDAQSADLARGLAGVQKHRAAERIWEELLKAPLTGSLRERSDEALQWQLERLHNQWSLNPQTLEREQAIRQHFTALLAHWPAQASPLTWLRRAQLALRLEDFALAQTDFAQVLQSWPGNLIARQGVALSLHGLQRYQLAHTALKDLQDWTTPTDFVYRDAAVRLASIEYLWDYRALPFQRTQTLKQPLPFEQPVDENTFEAEQLQASFASDDLAYTGYARGNLQDFFIGNAYTRYAILTTGHTLSWIHPQTTSEGILSPALQQQVTLEAERYQKWGESDWFSFQRGGVRWQQYWRHESDVGPLHYWLRPALAYRWGVPEPFRIGMNQHGHAELQGGVQWDRHQALQWESDLKFGQAELFLGGFYNYGSLLRWRWRDVIRGRNGRSDGVWGIDLLAGLQNYLVLDGDGGQQNLFRQLNGLEMVYQDKHWEYSGKFDISPIYGTLSDVNLNTSHHLKQKLTEAWDLEYRLEAHHYSQPVQRFQNQWRAQAGVIHHFDRSLQPPLSLALGMGVNHFYSADFLPSPQLYLELRTGR